MEPQVGIFSSRLAAEEAVKGLRAIALANDAIVFLTPESPEERLSAVPTTDAEGPGVGKAISGVVGAAIGGGAGLSLGSMVASLAVPGVGVVFAAGLGAAALLGIGGAAAGAALGEASEKAGDIGVPRDDVMFYRELLQQGRSLVVASAESEEMATAAQAVLHRNGAQDVSSARREWHLRQNDSAA